MDVGGSDLGNATPGEMLRPEATKTGEKYGLHPPDGSFKEGLEPFSDGWESPLGCSMK